MHAHTAKIIWEFDAWVKFSNGGGGHRTCYVGNSFEVDARKLLSLAYPGSRMDGDATRITADEASVIVLRRLRENEVFVTRL